MIFGQMPKNMLPLIDIFRNREIEFDYNLEQVKSMYASFALPHHKIKVLKLSYN